MSKLLILLIKLYQNYYSRFRPSRCVYKKTCSRYAIDVLKKFGFTKGAYLTIKRILRCF